MGTGMSSIRSNGMSFGRGNNISSAEKVGVGSVSMIFIGVSFIGVSSVCVSFSNNNGVGFSIKIGIDDNPGDAIVCLSILSAMVIGLAFFRFNVVVLISPTTGRGHSTPISSMI